MDQRSTSAKNSTIIQGATARTCELRLERHTGTADGTERVEYLCGASGGPEHGSVLGVVGEDLSSMVTICNACPIPAALEGHKSCLNLVPVRRFSCKPLYQEVMQAERENLWSREITAQFVDHPVRAVIQTLEPEAARLLTEKGGEVSRFELHRL